METQSHDITIDKQQIAAMPTVVFDGEITVVQTAEEAEAVLTALAAEKIVGFDTETKPSFKKGHINTVSLLQLSTDKHCVLIRLNHTGFTDAIRSFLEDENVIKIGLSLKDDFGVLHRLGDFTPRGFVDLQTMVRKYHIADSSLQKIYGIIFGKRISKSQRLSNWEAPTLTHSQCLYASTDAWACLRIYRTLLAGLFHPVLPAASSDNLSIPQSTSLTI